MADADVFVFPSPTATFGVVLLEALACGVPVAAFPVQGPIDVITDTRVGVLSDELHHAAMTALSLKPSDCQSYAMQYTWEKCTQQFVDNLVATMIDNSYAINIGKTIKVKPTNHSKQDISP